MSEIKVKDMRRGNFYMVENYVLDEYGADIGPYGIAIYSALCRFASQDGRSYPSYDRLAQITGMSKRRAIQSIEQLIALDLVEKESGQSNGKTNVYCILDLPRIASRATTIAPDACTIAPDAHLPLHHVQSNKTHSNNTQEQENSNNSASLAAARLEESMKRIQPDEETHSDLAPRYDRSEEQQLYQEIVGRTLRPGDKNKLEKLSERASKEQIIRAMSRTAEAAKKGTRIHDGVAYVCRMVDIVVDEESGKTSERDTTYSAIVAGRRGAAAADIDWTEVNKLYSPFGVIDAIPQ